MASQSPVDKFVFVEMDIIVLYCWFLRCIRIYAAACIRLPIEMSDLSLYSIQIIMTLYVSSAETTTTYKRCSIQVVRASRVLQKNMSINHILNEG